MKKLQIAFIAAILLITASCKQEPNVVSVECNGLTEPCYVKLDNGKSEYRTYAWVKNNRPLEGKPLHPVKDIYERSWPENLETKVSCYREVILDSNTLAYEAICMPDMEWMDYVPAQRFISTSKPHVGEDVSFKASEWAPGGYITKYERKF